jgi:hypothetical protein
MIEEGQLPQMAQVGQSQADGDSENAGGDKVVAPL